MFVIVKNLYFGASASKFYLQSEYWKNKLSHEMLVICHCKLEMCILKIKFYIFGVMQKGQWEIGSFLPCVVFVEGFILFCDHG